MKKTTAANGDTFDLQGHRGCRGLMPENTIPAMIKAIDLGVTTIEMDVVISKDKQVVVSHEPFMSAEISTSPSGQIPTFQDQRRNNIYQMDYAEIKLWDVGLRPLARFPKQEKMKAYKPLLTDLIDSVEQYVKENSLRQVQYNIEIKSSISTDSVYHPAPGEFVALVLQVIRLKNISNRVIIQSFDKRVLQHLHKAYPHIKSSFLVEGTGGKSVEQQINELGFYPTVYSPEFHLVDTHMLDYCKSKKMKLIPWTINDVATFQKLKSMGVDGIITDYPDLAMKN